MPAAVKPLDSFPELYKTQRFITAFTRALHLSQSSPHNPILTLPTYILDNIKMDLVKIGWGGVGFDITRTIKK
jgi:hypothetical protein